MVVPVEKEKAAGAAIGFPGRSEALTVSVYVAVGVAEARTVPSPKSKLYFVMVPKPVVEPEASAVGRADRQRGRD